jgi:biopolymer transport protein ExbB
MKKHIQHVLFFLILPLIVTVPRPQAETWKDTAVQVEADIQQTLSDAEETRKIIAGEKAGLTRQLDQAAKETALAEQTLKDLKEKFEALVQEEEKLRREIQAGEHSADALAEKLRTAAKDAESMFQASLISPEMPLLKQNLESLLDPSRFPGMEEVQALADAFFSEMAASGQVSRRTGPFVTAQGEEIQGEIIRVGKFTAFYNKDGEAGYLRLDQGSQRLVQIPGDPPWQVRRAIRGYFSGQTETLPLDLSGGIIAEQVNHQSDMGEWLASGGVLVWPILLIGLAALLLSLERLFTLGRIPTRTDDMMNRFRQLAAEADWTGCGDLCKNNAPVCNVLKAGLENRGYSREVIENALEEAILGELPRLDRFLSTLSILAALSPLLGLLGTVNGMIHTFQGITVFGTSDPRMMSGGISEALITTQLGLGIAIPITLIHHFFDRRVEKIVADLEEKGTALITILMKT